jgi:hypothetical protein
VGRPCTNDEVRDLVIRLARNNRAGGAGFTSAYRSAIVRLRVSRAGTRRRGRPLRWR